MFLTAKQVETSLREGAHGFMMLLCVDGEKKVKIEELPIVYKFPKVFLDDIPGLPPPREVEFAIDLVPETGPISIAPYWMSPLELSELKK